METIFHHLVVHAGRGDAGLASGGLPLVAGYIVLVERKVLADFQVRLGPMRVGPHGLLQPIADALKLLHQGRHHPGGVGPGHFLVGALHLHVHRAHGFRGAAVQPRIIYVADVNVGLLVVSAMSAVGILGIILGGWSSNSHYPLLGALRSAAQLVSYEVALAFALLSGVMVAGTLSMQGIVRGAARARHLGRLRQLRFHDRAVRAVHHRRDRRNQPRAVRPARSGIRAGGRLPHRVQRLPLGALLPGRVRQHLRGVARWR